MCAIARIFLCFFNGDSVPKRLERITFFSSSFNCNAVLNRSALRLRFSICASTRAILAVVGSVDESTIVFDSLPLPSDDESSFSSLPAFFCCCSFRTVDARGLLVVIAGAVVVAVVVDVVVDGVVVVAGVDVVEVVEVVEVVVVVVFPTVVVDCGLVLAFIFRVGGAESLSFVLDGELLLLVGCEPFVGFATLLEDGAFPAERG